MEAVVIKTSSSTHSRKNKRVLEVGKDNPKSAPGYLIKDHYKNWRGVGQNSNYSYASPQPLKKASTCKISGLRNDVVGGVVS